MIQKKYFPEVVQGFSYVDWRDKYWDSYFLECGRLKENFSVSQYINEQCKMDLNLNGEEIRLMNIYAP